MTSLRAVEQRVLAEYRDYHVRAQVTRLLLAAGTAALGALMQGGPGPWDWKVVLPLAWGAAWTALRAYLRTALQTTALEHIADAGRDAALASRGTAPPGGAV